jgi:hypothetical protein
MADARYNLPTRVPKTRVNTTTRRIPGVDLNAHHVGTTCHAQCLSRGPHYGVNTGLISGYQGLIYGAIWGLGGDKGEGGSCGVGRQGVRGVKARLRLGEGWGALVW